MSATITATAGTAQDFAPLPSGHLACLACGMPVPGEGGVVRAEALGRLDVPAGLTQRPVPVEFSRCPACIALHERARELVAEHPRLAARIGSTSVAVDRVECALVALAALGRSLPSGPVSDAELGRLVRHLAAAGASARWMARFVPMVARGVRPGTYALTPWAHVDAEPLRRGYAQVLRERVAASAPASAIAPPQVEEGGGAAVPGGCLMCGVSAVHVAAADVARAGGPANAARDAWSPRQVGLAALGGRGPERLSGHVCHLCEQAVEHMGAVGPSAMERSLIQYLRPEVVGRLPYGAPRFDGLLGWGTLVADAQRRGTPAPPPNERRWGHVEGQDALRERLTALLG